MGAVSVRVDRCPGQWQDGVVARPGPVRPVVVEEAVTDVISRQQSCGIDEPWLRDDFVDLIVRLQQQRQTAQISDTAAVQFYDRSPLCTMALARYLGRPVTPMLAQEVDRVLREEVYERVVFLVRPLGFIEATAARRIDYAGSLAFEQVHETVYREHGFELVDVPAASLADRAAIVEAHLTGEEKSHRP